MIDEILNKIDYGRSTLEKSTPISYPIISSEVGETFEDGEHDGLFNEANQDEETEINQISHHEEPVESCSKDKGLNLKKDNPKKRGVSSISIEKIPKKNRSKSSYDFRNTDSRQLGRMFKSKTGTLLKDCTFNVFGLKFILLF